MAQFQFGWRFCLKCSNMTFKDSVPGACVAGGDHHPQGFDFALPYDRVPSATDDGRFYFCRQCHSLFQEQDFGGGELGTCAKGGQHDRTNSIEFVLPHDEPVPDGQDKWFVCVNCNVLFWGPAAQQHCVKNSLSHDAGENAPNFNVPHTLNPGDFIP